MTALEEFHHMTTISTNIVLYNSHSVMDKIIQLSLSVVENICRNKYVLAYLHL